MKYSAYEVIQIRLSNRQPAEDMTIKINEKLAEGWHFIAFPQSERADTPMVLFGKPE